MSLFTCPVIIELQQGFFCIIELQSLSFCPSIHEYLDYYVANYLSFEKKHTVVRSLVVGLTWIHAGSGAAIALSRSISLALQKPDWISVNFKTF